MDKNQERAIRSNISYYEKFYVLEYCRDECLSKRDELDYYLSKGAAVKHLQVVRLEPPYSIHSIVISIPRIIIEKAAFDS